jgi:hypothetical protein
MLFGGGGVGAAVEHVAAESMTCRCGLPQAVSTTCKVGGARR